MQAKELFHSDGKSSGVWFCSECKIVKRTEAEAEQCCTPRECADCGQPLSKERRGWSVCERCWDCREEKRRHERLEKAVEVDSSESVMLMVEEFCGNGDDGWFRHIDEIVDYGCDEDPDCRPEFAFCSKPQQRQINLGDVLERLCEDGYEDMGENFYGVKELQAAVDRFNELNKEQMKVYDVDYSRKVRIPWPAPVAKSE